MRRSGILMHISSLPGPEYIGTLGPEAFFFADHLHEAGISIWQVLPCTPVGYGYSPYQSSSAFAGNPLLISARMLKQDGLLDGTLPLSGGQNVQTADYESARRMKRNLAAAGLRPCGCRAAQQGIVIQRRALLGGGLRAFHGAEVKNA